jgi:hypothetical protein
MPMAPAVPATANTAASNTIGTMYRFIPAS